MDGQKLVCVQLLICLVYLMFYEMNWSLIRLNWFWMDEM